MRGSYLRGALFPNERPHLFVARVASTGPGRTGTNDALREHRWQRPRCDPRHHGQPHRHQIKPGAQQLTVEVQEGESDGARLFREVSCNCRRYLLKRVRYPEASLSPSPLTNTHAQLPPIHHGGPSGCGPVRASRPRPVRLRAARLDARPRRRRLLPGQPQAQRPPRRLLRQLHPVPGHRQGGFLRPVRRRRTRRQRTDARRLLSDGQHAPPHRRHRAQPDRGQREGVLRQALHAQRRAARREDVHARAHGQPVCQGGLPQPRGALRGPGPGQPHARGLRLRDRSSARCTRASRRSRWRARV